jgi:hypothetical protein
MVIVVVLLMIVDQVHVVCVVAAKAEDDAPVRPDGHAPETLKVAFEGVKPKAGQVHIVRLSSAVQNGKDVFELLDVLLPDALALRVLEEPFEALMPEALNHSSSYL